MEIAILKAINKVQAELAREGIGKTRKNQAQGYSFRGIDDMYNVLSPLLAGQGIVVLPSYSDRQVVERENKNGTALFYTTIRGDFTFRSSEDGSEVKVATYGEAMDSGDKATNKAMSAALKYAFMQTFTIPTEGDNDSENQTHEVTSQRGSAKPGTPAEMKRDAFEAMPEEEKEFLRKIAADATALVGEDRTDDAHGYLENQKLDMEEKLALWFLLDSKTRAALQKAGARADLERRATERNKHQQSRPAAQAPQ